MAISVQINNEGGTDVVFYSGPINEDAEVHLAQVLPKVGKSCTFNFRNVEYVNSCGVRAWINFMRELEKGRTIVFAECTPDVVMQINMIPSFRGTAEIQSVTGAYTCGNCGHKQKVLFTKGSNLPTEEGNYPEVKCEKCNSTSEMEELEEEFFSFAVAS